MSWRDPTLDAAAEMAAGPVMATGAVAASAQHTHEEAARVRAQRTSDTPLPLAVVGCDFRVGSTAWRNRLLLQSSEREQLLHDLRPACGAEGLVVLETCNRVEWLVVAPQPQWAAEVVRAQMVERWRDQPELQRGTHWPQPYLYVGRSAVQHILRVAVGLESFVVGEREIAGQLNRALMTARQAGHASVLHNALQTAVGRTVRKVARLPTWRHHARGVHGLALEAVRHFLAERPPHPDGRERPEVAVVGMGEIGRKTAHLLASYGGCHVHPVNRTVPEAHAGQWQPLGALPQLLERVDAVVIATGAREPILDLTSIVERQPQLLVVDLGAPAQVSGTQRVPPWVRWQGLDALLSLPVLGPEPTETQLVLEMVDEGVREFLVECSKRDLAQLLRATHDRYDELAWQQLPQFLHEELADLDPDRRKRIEANLRGLLRGFARDLVQEIEEAAESRTRTRRK